MFREPEEIAAAQAAVKLDQIAATRRSSIRRESTVRPGRHSSTRSLIERIRESRRDAANGQRNTAPPPPPQMHREVERGMFDLDSELERLRSIRQRHHARATALDRELARRAANNDYVRPEPEPRTDVDVELLSRLRSHPGTVSLEELNSEYGIEFLLSDSQESVPQHLPRPSRESGLRFEVAATSQIEPEQPRRTRFHGARATRVSSPSGARRSGAPIWSLPVQRPSADDLEDDDNESAGLTPGFTPARGSYPSTSQQPDERRPVDGLLDTPPPESLEASYAPLRRVNHFSPHPLGVSGSRVDGLGDRLRSPSPTSDPLGEENWSSLLAQVEPGRSSSATSFLSSRSDSRSGSNQSSQATTAATSFGEIGGDDSCDLDLPSGITEEDVRAIRARHGRLRRDHESVHEQIQRDLARGNERMMELEMFGVILERMQRREEIPDEWWAAVGLSPDIVRGSA